MTDLGAPAQRDPILLRWLDMLTQALNVIGSSLILMLMVLMGVDVLGRTLANQPVSGVPEMVSLSIVAIVFLQIPQALRAGRMTQSDAFLGWFQRRYRVAGNILATIFDLAGMVIVWVIVQTTWPIFTRAWQRGEFVGALGDFTAPVWPVKLTLIVGGVVLILQFGARIWRRWAGAADGRV